MRCGQISSADSTDADVDAYMDADAVWHIALPPIPARLMSPNREFVSTQWGKMCRS